MSSMYSSFGGAPARPCMRCGNPLTINETQCSRCGTFNPLPQGQQFGTFQQGAQGKAPDPSASAWGAQAQQSPYAQQPGNGAWPGSNQNASSWESRGQAGSGQQNNLFGGQNQGAFPSQPLQNNSFGSGMGSQNPSAPLNFPQNGNQSAFPNSFGRGNFQQNAERPSLNSFLQATRQNGYGNASSATPNRPPWMQRPGNDEENAGGGKGRGKGKKTPNTAGVIVIVVVLLLVVGIGGFGGYYYLSHRASGAPASAPTTTTKQTISTPTTTPLFHDVFSNNKTGWDTNKNTGQSVKVSNGQLVLTTENKEILQEILPGGKSYPDLEVDVDAGLASGGDPNNGYGVYIRATADQNGVLNTYYRFEVYGDGSFVVYKAVIDNTGKSNARDIGHSDPNNAITHVGTLNHLTIIAKGQTLKFIINGTTVATIKDTSYKSGTVALFASQVTSATTSAQAIFKNLALFPAP